MKTNTLFQVRFRPSVTPPRGFTKSAHYNVTSTRNNMAKSRDEYLIGNTWLPAKDFIKIEVEDAPVFQKPILRKIASLKPDEVIECNTDAESKAVLEQAEREGLVWQYSGRLKPTKYVLNTPHCIGLSDSENNYIAQISLESAKIEKYTILPASKFVEVGTKGVIEDLPTGKELIQSHIDAQFEKPQGEIEWITDPSQVNFKENAGRQFEMFMRNGKIEKGEVVGGKSWQANILGKNKDGEWYFDLNTDGTLNSGVLGENFKFRWISEKPAPAPELKPFPDGYVIPEGTRVVVIESHRYGGENYTYIKAGETGTTIDESTCPDVKFDSGILHHNGESYLDVYNHNLAPLDPLDHPEHPEFGKNKQEEPITQAQKDECVKIDELALRRQYIQNKFQETANELLPKIETKYNEIIKILKEIQSNNNESKSQEPIKIDDEIFKNPFSNQGALVDAHNQLTGQIETMKRLAKIALSNDHYEHIRIVLRAIAKGEI